ncbi:MAG: SDR family oxidoreductase [Pseudomonadota bacterium]
MNLNNKTAVITGGAGGIGSTLARALHREGANVVVSDLNLEAAQAVADEIGGKALACDVTKEEQIKALIALAEEAYGQVDIFVSNAGFGSQEPDHVASQSNEMWQLQWDVHVMSHVYASRDLLPKMIARGDGYLVNVASAAGLLAQISDAAYSATKHAAVSFAEALKIGHAHQGVKVSVVCPQYVNTDIIGDAKVSDPADFPEGLITPEQCVDTIVQGLKDETFLILPHPEVAKFSALRAADPTRWLGGMSKLRASLMNEEGKIDLKRMFVRE